MIGRSIGPDLARKGPSFATSIALAQEWSRGLALAGCLAACNVPRAPASSGGVELDGGGEDGGAHCPSALVVANSDYASTNVSILSPAGVVLSESIISSGSATAGLTTALSGDVVVPLASTPRQIVLIDRYPNSVVSWVDPSTAAVVHQLNVGTGFAANPHDYVAISDTKAYVSRYETNPNAGRQPYDGGGDLLIVDPSKADVTGRVPFDSSGAFLPRPDRMLRVGDEVWVSLHRFDADFSDAGDARIAGVSTADDSITWTLDLPGVASCGGLTRTPSGNLVAVSCSGLFDSPNERSAVVLLDASQHPPVEKRRFAIASQLGSPPGTALAFANDVLLLGTTLGDVQAGRNDLAFSVDVESGATEVIADAGTSFVFGDVRCAPNCTDLCFLADAHANVLRVWKVNGSALAARESVPVDPGIGLPPRSIGAL